MAASMAAWKKAALLAIIGAAGAEGPERERLLRAESVGVGNILQTDDGITIVQC